MRPLNLINHLTIGHGELPTLCQTPQFPNVTMDGAPMVVDGDLFIPHRYTVLDPTPHEVAIRANPTNVFIGGKPVATEFSLTDCMDITQCIAPTKTNIGQPVGTAPGGPASGPRSNFNVFVKRWPTITYRDTSLSVRYQRGDPDAGRSDIIRYVCRSNPIRPDDAFTPIAVSGPGDIQGEEPVVPNFAGEPFSRRSGCAGLPNWAKFLEEPVKVAIKIREVATFNRQRNGNLTQVDQLDPNVLSYEPEVGTITGLSNYSAGYFFTVRGGSLARRADILLIKYQPGFYFGGGLRFPREEKINEVYVAEQTIKVNISSTTNNCPE